MMKKMLPEWLKQDIPDMDKIREMKQLFGSAQLNTVCQEARCPNLGNCWEKKVATFMILGNVCTRNCLFCAVTSGRPLPVSDQEPRHVAEAVAQLKLKYVVITSVTRDDLIDQGATQFVKTIKAIREVSPETKIEVLIPDLSVTNQNLSMVVKAQPDVIGHNIETVKRVFQTVRAQADYSRSLAILNHIKKIDSSMIVKSGFMVGLGETREEISDLIKDLISSQCDILSIGQYLAPRQNQNVEVQRFISLDEFESYKNEALAGGLKYVISGPKVRSSYLAEEGYDAALDAIKKNDKTEDDFFPFNI